MKPWPWTLVLMLAVALGSPSAWAQDGISDEEQAWKGITESMSVRWQGSLLLCTATDEGVARVDGFVERWPTSAHREEARYLQAIGRWNLYRYADAADYYSAFLAAFPKSKLAGLALNRWCWSMCWADRPAEALEAAEGLSRTSDAYYRVRSTAYNMLGKPDEAMAALKAGLAPEAGVQHPRFLEQDVVWQEMVGKPVKSFRVKPHGGGDLVGPPDWLGKVILIDFWATWCRPCLAEMPHLIAAWERFQGSNVMFFGVSADREQAKLDAVLEEMGISWPQHFDGQTRNRVVELFNVRRFPSNVIVDAKGRVRVYNIKGPGVERIIRELLEEATEE